MAIEVTQEIYVVERHDDDYYGPQDTKYAETVDTALEIAREMRDEHRGETWRIDTGTRSDERLSFHPEGERGWITVKKDMLFE